MEKLIFFFFSHPLKGTLSDLVMACNFSKMSRQQGVKTSVNIWNNQAACTQRLARCVEAWRRASLEVLLLSPVSERNAATVLKERLPGSVMNKSTLYRCKWVLLSDNRSRKISTVRVVFLSRIESRESTDRWLVHGQYRLLKIRKSHILIWSENEALCQKEKKKQFSQVLFFQLLIVWEDVASEPLQHIWKCVYFISNLTEESQTLITGKMLNISPDLRQQDGTERRFSWPVCLARFPPLP